VAVGDLHLARVEAIDDPLGQDVEQQLPGARTFGLEVVQDLRQQARVGVLELLEAADDMPAEDYGFKPGTAAEMRTYGQVLLHVAESQFATCASLKGIANAREGRSLERDVTAKTDVIKVLSESFAICDDVFGTLTDASAAEFMKVGEGEVVRGAVIAGLLAHDSEMYGIATVYLRARNLVPPSTRRQMQQGPIKPK